VFVFVVFALVPVGVQFGDDPLLRLRQLDPQLSPPEATADCGSPVRNLKVEPVGTSLYDVARASGCENAALRRLLVAIAAGSAIFMSGLIGLIGLAPPETRTPETRTPESRTAGRRADRPAAVPGA
jgi:hypothetical protein